MVSEHQEALHGNGKDGLVTRVATLASGKVDTLSVKSVCLLLAAFGTLTGTIGAALMAFAR